MITTKLMPPLVIIYSITRPSVRVTQITPSVEGEFLLNVALAVGYRGPRAEVVLQDVVDGWSFHDYTIHLQ